MFGYVRIRKPELKVKDYETYHSFYCGLCERLRERYGVLGQVTLTYDMTFLVILLTSVYDVPVQKKQKRCMVHPRRKHLIRISEMTDYAADMNMILSFYKFRDEWEDEASVKGVVGMKMYQKSCLSLKEKYPEQFLAVSHNLKRLSVLESRHCDDIMEVADCFGRLMAGLVAVRKDAFADYLGRLGYYLGRFIYILDAYDDLSEDLEKGRYNPFADVYRKEGFEEMAHQMLLDEIATASAAFEMLPCLEYCDILRNILYAGVWNRYDDIQTQKRKSGEKEEKTDRKCKKQRRKKG